MSTQFDFKEKASELFKRINPKAGSPMSPELARAAIEIALREAYTLGAGQSKGSGGVKSSSQAKAAGKSAVASGSTFRASAPVPANAAPAGDCAHDWEEVFLDGRAIGGKCIHCDVLQKDVQERCDHYFVAVGGNDVCVACRKPRRAASR